MNGNVLMGLVSDHAAVVYERLCAAGGLSEDVEAVDVESPAVAELLQAGVVCFSRLTTRRAASAGGSR